MTNNWSFNHLSAELNPICHLLALLGAHHILHVSRIRVKESNVQLLVPVAARSRGYVCGRASLDTVGGL